MIDAGVAWGLDAETAYKRACQFAPYKPTWLEEPVLAEAVEQYARIKELGSPVPIAGGEGCNTYRAAEDFVRHATPDYVQIDVGRIGGITPADRVCRLAQQAGVTYVNHTFKSHLQLAASLHVFAGVEQFRFLEYPDTPSPLARELTTTRLQRDIEGMVRVPEVPGLGLEVNLDTVRKYLQPVRIEVAGRMLFESGPI
jgi:L-alanine-DL-glutamate epimerase-like enolase superfamily enzyme